MASNPDLVQYIADQMSRAGEITFKKMFGEYGLYCNGKFFAMVCDDRLLFKPHGRWTGFTWYANSPIALSWG